MKRRTFITLVGGVAAYPFATQAQERPRRIAVIFGYLQNDPDAQARASALVEGLQALGWAQGRNIHIDYGYAGNDIVRLRETAQALVASRPDLIVVQSNPGVIALREVDRSIPAVFVQVGDPVGSGFVDGLSRPGANLTGFSTSDPEMGGKWVELLREVAPNARRVTIIHDPKIQGNRSYLPSAEAAAVMHNLELRIVGVHDISQIEHAIVESAREPQGALLVLPSPLTGSNRGTITRLALSYRLPAAYAFRSYVMSGGLLSYGPDPIDLFSRAAAYVDRILRGEKPADLPVQSPTKFNLSINLKTAKALGLDIPPTLLARADEVIE